MTIHGAAHYPAPGSFSVSGRLGSRTVCSFTLIDSPPGTVDIEVGEEVIATDASATRIFAGTVDSIAETYDLTDQVRTIDVNCVDYSQIADRHLVAYAYDLTDASANWKAGEIIRDVVDRFWRDGSVLEDIDTSHVADGPEIEKAVFNYLPASQVFDELAELTGYVWYIDYDKNLYFIDSTMNAAPFGLTTTGGQWRDLSISSNREMYRNKQYIRAGVAQTEERTDTVITTAADQRLLEFPYPVGSASAITEGGTPKTLGVKGFDEGKDYYWSYNSTIVEAAVAPGNAVSVALTYTGLFPILLSERDESEILERRTIEGGTGVYSAIYDDPQINVRAMATAKALALLRRYGTIPQVVSFQTYGAGLRPGQLLSIDIPGYDLSGNYLIESVDLNDYGGVLNRYDVSAVSGEPLGDWLDWFSRISRQGQKFRLYDEDIVNVLEYPTEGLIFEDAATETHGQPESRADHARTDFSETDWV